jgi:hypothetical protein
MVGAPHPAVFRPPRQQTLGHSNKSKQGERMRWVDASYVFLSRDVNSAVVVRMRGDKHRV